jgi:hypothetical protein
VRLITPCPSSDRWPDGYWVLDDRRFRDGEEFADLLEAMTERHMRATLRASDPARFRPDLTVTYDDDAIRAAGFGAATSVTNTPHLRDLGEAMAKGGLTAGELAVEHEDRYGRPAERTMHTLNEIFEAGVLDEEPRD